MIEALVILAQVYTSPLDQGPFGPTQPLAPFPYRDLQPQPPIVPIAPVTTCVAQRQLRTAYIRCQTL